MSLKNKRKIFFAVITALFFVLVALVMLHPILEWADAETLEGATVIGIPLSQFLIVFSAFGFAILVAVLFAVDTKILVEKSSGERRKSANESVNE